MSLPYEWKPKPVFRTTYEKEKYWAKQQNLWINGNGELTGTHIFYLQECKIKTPKGKIIRPNYRECDRDFFHAWEMSKRDGWDLLIIKRRRVGFSTMAAAIALHTSLLNPNSTSLITSADENRRKGLFDDKILTTFDLLDDDIRPEKARTKQQGYLYLATEDRKTKTFSGLKSKIVGVDTVKNPKAFEGYGAMFVLLDEIFIHPKANEASVSAMSSMMDDTDKIGTLLMGGTAGEATSKSVQIGKKIYTSSKENKTNTFFLGGTRGMAEFMTDGVDDEKRAEEWILKNREELSKADDKTKYFKFITDYPLSVEEVFNLVTDCVLPQECQVTLNNAERAIDTDGIKPGKYSVTTNGVSVQAVPDEIKGKIRIIKPPVKGHRYGAGTDPIPFGNNLLGEGSKYSIIIGDLDTKEAVADYTERNLDSQTVVRNSILLQKLYYGAQTMLELTRGEVVLKEYLAMGEHGLLAPMPTHLGIVYEDRKYPFGSSMNNQIAARCESLCIKFLLAHGYKLRHKDLIQEFRRLGTDANTDILDAWKMFLLFDAEMEEVKKYAVPSYSTHKIRTFYRDQATGRMLYKDVESQILNR